MVKGPKSGGISEGDNPIGTGAFRNTFKASVNIQNLQVVIGLSKDTIQVERIILKKLG